MKPSKTGYWTQRTHLLRDDEFICSACNASGKKPYKECPACGAAMKKSKYDPSWVDEEEELSALLDDEW